MFSNLTKKNKTNIIDGLLNVRTNKELFNSFTELQNEITVGFNTKIIAISSLDNDTLAAAFAKAFSDVYSLNGSSYLIIDANLYNPCLNDLLGSQNKNISFFEIRDGNYGSNKNDFFSNTKDKVISMNKSVYPSDVYKNKAVHQIVNENSTLYDHIIIIVPSIKSHKEIALLKDILGSVLLVTQKNETKKEDIFYAIQFCEDNRIPLAKTIVIK